MNRLRGIGVGAGYFSHFQYEAWNRIPEVAIIALCNRSVAKAAPVAEQYGIEKVSPWPDLGNLLDETKPDFIDIITPPETHPEVVQLAASKGINIICQKPLAPTLKESRQIVKLAKNAGIRFMVHENWRWQPWYREIKRHLDRGILGQLHSISVRMRMGDGWREDAYLARQPFFRDYPRLLVYETGVHFLDTFRFLGGEVATVYARLQKRNPTIEGEDSGQIVVGFESGATAILDASRYNETDYRDPRYTFGTVRIDGSKGHMELAEDGRLLRKLLGQSTASIDYPHGYKGFAGDCVHNLQRHFVDCFLTGAPFESTGDDYLKSIALVEACYRSSQSGKVECAKGAGGEEERVQRKEFRERGEARRGRAN